MIEHPADDQTTSSQPLSTVSTTSVVAGAAPLPEPNSFTIDAETAGERLDRYLTTKIPGISRSRVQSLIASGEVAVDGAVVGDAGYRVKPGEVVTVSIPPPIAAKPAAEDLPLDIVFEDAQLIVIDKPAGLVVHPSAGHGAGTLVNALLSHCGDSLSGIGGVRRPGIVHRLDRDTTGLIVAAKSDEAHRGLSEQFAAHGRDGRLERAYMAVVWGALPSVMGTIDAPLARSTANRTRMQVVAKGSRARIGKGGTWLVEDEEDEDGGRTSPRGPRQAITHYQLIETFMGVPAPGRAAVPIASLVKVSLETGRTHQIRVHMAHIGHPVLGDPTYGAHFKASERRLSEPQADALRALGRQALHAAVLGFEHPVSGRSLRFESPLPADMARLVTALRGPLPATGSERGPRSRKVPAKAKVKGISPGKIRRRPDVDED